MARRIAGRAAVAVVPAVLIVLGVVAFAATGGTTRLSLLGARPFHATQVVGQDFPKRLVDPSGIPQTLAAPPNRILSGVLASDEILTALVPPERLVAVTYLVDEPGLSDVAKLLPPDLPRIYAEAENMLALRPDLVVLASYTRATTVRLLVAAGIPVVRFQWYRSFADIMNSIRMLAAAVGRSATVRGSSTTCGSASPRWKDGRRAWRGRACCITAAAATRPVRTPSSTP